MVSPSPAIIVAALLSACSVAAASDQLQDAQQTTDVNPPAAALPTFYRPLEVTLTPGVWVPRLGGDVTFDATSADDPEVDLDDVLGLDESDAVVNVELAIRQHDRWQLDFSGMDFSADQSATFEGNAAVGDLELNPGDAFRTSFELTSIAAELSYWAGQPRRMGLKPGRTRESRTDLRFAPFVGVRYIDVDHTVEVVGEGREDGGGEWAALYLGGRLQLRHNMRDASGLIKTLELNGGIGLGPALGGDGGFMVQLRADLTAYFSPNIGVTFGYRLLELDVEHEGYELTGGLQGLFLGAVLRF